MCNVKTRYFVKHLGFTFRLLTLTSLLLVAWTCLRPQDGNAIAVASQQTPHVPDAVEQFVLDAQAAGARKDAAAEEKAWLACLAKTIEIKDRHREAGAHFLLGTFYQWHGQPTRALEYFHQAVTVATAAGEKHFLAESLTQLAETYLKQGEADKALEYFPRAVQAWEVMGDRAEMAHCRNDAGSIYFSQGDFAQARDWWDKGLADAEAAQHREFIADISNNEAAICLNQGEYDAALHYLEAAANSPKVADVRYNLGILHFFLGNFDQAQRDLRETWNRSKSSTQTRARIQTIRGHISLYHGLLVAETPSLHNTDLNDAATLYQDGWNLIKPSRARHSPYPDDAAACQVGLSSVYLAQNKLAEAQRACETALTLLKETHAPSEMIPALTNLGNVQFQRGHYRQAQTWFQRALRLASKTNNRVEMARAHRFLGQALQAQRDEKAAERAYRAAISDFEAAEQHIPDPRQIGYVHDAQLGSPYALLVGLLARKGEAREAMTIFDRGRSHGLARQAVQARLSLAAFAGLPRTSRRVTTAKPVRATGLASKSLNTLVRRNPETLFLAFSLGDNKGSFLLTASQTDGFATFPLLPNPRDKQSLAILRRNWRIQLQEPAPMPEGSRNEHTLARQLFQMLLGALEKSGRLNPGRYTRLVVVLDGPTLDLPFAALEDERGRRLIDRFSLSSATSLASLLPQTSSRRASKTLLCVADPLGDGTSLPLDTRMGSLGALPGARQAAKQVCQLFGAEPILGARASKEAVMRAMPSYDLLHFGVHGILDTQNGLRSSLVLAAPSFGRKAFRNAPAYLTAEEIMKMRLSARMVALPACNTGLGQVSGGEGLLGLTWAFQAAGCRSVVASLWSVKDDATGQLMVSFYTALQKEQRTKDQALQQAMQAVKRRPQWSAPYYWAAIQVVGDTAPLVPRRL